MSDAPETGGCLCGAVRFTARAPKRAIQACHCRQCRRWTGGSPYYAVRVKDLVFEREPDVTTYNASDHGERASCARCGSILWWRLTGRSIAFVAAGLLDDQTGFAITHDIFCDNAADWTPRAAGATQSTEAELQAQLAAFLNGDTP